MGIFNRLFGRMERPKGLVASIRLTAVLGVAMYSTFALFSHHVISRNHCEGPSMYPTIPSETTMAVFSRRHKRGRDVKIGDVILFRNPVFLRESACKRVIGMPGDFVLLDTAQSPTVGGAPVPGITDDKDAWEEPTMVQVPEGHVWVAGDNLSYSRDSRFYGPVPMALITGKVLYNGSGWFRWTSFRGPQLQSALEPDRALQEP